MGLDNRVMLGVYGATYMVKMHAPLVASAK
jgi:hypothetical protein